MERFGGFFSLFSFIICLSPTLMCPFETILEFVPSCGRVSRWPALFNPVPSAPESTETFVLLVYLKGTSNVCPQPTTGNESTPDQSPLTWTQAHSVLDSCSGKARGPLGAVGGLFCAEPPAPHPGGSGTIRGDGLKLDIPWDL